MLAPGEGFTLVATIHCLTRLCVNSATPLYLAPYNFTQEIPTCLMLSFFLLSLDLRRALLSFVSG